MSFGIWELLIVLVIVVLLFGTKKLPKLSSFGSEIGSAIKNFRGAVKEGKDAQKDISGTEPSDENRVIEGEVEKEEAVDTSNDKS